MLRTVLRRSVGGGMLRIILGTVRGHTGGMLRTVVRTAFTGAGAESVVLSSSVVVKLVMGI